MFGSKHLRSALALLAAAVLCSTAQAALFRAYLSSDGNDANPCTLPAPCRLLPAALNAVADGGEIWMLDSANFNTATVTVGKSVSILAVPGAVGSVLAIGGSAISIPAGGLKVALRNLVIVPLAGAVGTFGVSMSGASTLTIEDSLIANLSNDAVFVTGGNTKITNTTMRNNGGRAVWASNGANVSISGSKMLENASGGVVASNEITATTVKVVVSDSIISGANFGAAAINNLAGGNVQVFVTRCSIDNSLIGLNSRTNNVGSALISVSSSMIATNTYAWYQDGTGSVIESSGNNHIRGYANTVGALTNVGLQ